MSRVYSLNEVKSGGLIAIRGKVYDVTKFLKFHPGGYVVLEKTLGKDVTKEFELYHDADKVLRQYGARLQVGVLNTFNADEKAYRLPYSEPISFSRFNSPYYKETHHKFRQFVNHFVETEIRPTMHEWELKAEPPRAIYKKMGAAGLLACMCGPPFPAQYVPKGTPIPEDFDYFHEVILYDELAKLGNGAVVAGLTNGPAIALSAVLRFGTQDMKAKVAPAVLSGEKFIALAISEPQAGSDIQGLTTTAIQQGDKFIVNGNKKYITNGTYADYFVTAVATNPTAKDKTKGLSFLLIDRTQCSNDGLSVRKLILTKSDISGKLLRSAHAQSLATVSICHGPAAFLSAQEENKEFIYNGYKFAAFPDIVDKITPFLGYLPGHMEWYFGEKLAALGMEITNVVPAGAVYQHKELLTGDGPDAANELGKMFVDLLSKK